MKGAIELLNLILVMVMILVFSISLMLAYTINEDLIDNSEINETYLTYAKNAMGVFDAGFIFIVFGIIMATVIGAFMIYSHPVFAVASIMILIFVVILAAIFANVYSEYVEVDEIEEAAADFPMMSTAWQNFPLIILVGSVLIIIALYAKFGGGGA